MSAPEELQAAAEPRSSMLLHVSAIMALGTTYIIFSAGMITFNKHLMSPTRFPYASTLVLIHMGFSSMLTLGLYLIRPSMFPSLTCPEKKITVDRDLILKGALPIALLFSVNLVLSNTAYKHSSVAFLQMMKEGNIVLVYLFSLLAGQEAFSSIKGCILCFVVCATTATVRGELQFSLLGFCQQGIAQVFESIKIVLQACLLTNAGRKLDAFSYNLIVAPLCFSILSAIFILLVYAHPMEEFATPSWNELNTWAPVLIANASIAFALNITVAFFIKNSSAVSFIMAGIVKDSMIVTSGVIFMGEQISRVQIIAFAIQIYLIWLWSMMKTFPALFSNSTCAGIMAVHCGRWSLEKQNLESSARPRFEAQKSADPTMATKTGYNWEAGSTQEAPDQVHRHIDAESVKQYGTNVSRV